MKTTSDLLGTTASVPRGTNAGESPAFDVKPMRVCSTDLSHGVGHSLRVMRRERKLSQLQLGKAAGLSPSTVSEIELGSNNLSMDVLWRLCAAMSVKPLVMFETATRDEQRRVKRAGRAS
jgi:DNA-binding XRE family transcriptional regulator